jgi:hypothetical protein
MPSFSFEVPHQMGKEAAKTRLEGFLDRIGQQYQGQISGLDGKWIDNRLEFSFSTFGIKISGSMTVEDDRVVFQGDLPFSAMVFKGKISSGIQEALQKALK